MTNLPRLVVAAPASGHGKTTVATGLMAALRAAGHTVSGHKVGPDYIDPGYHALATGRPGRNLDPHLVGPDRIAPLLLHGAATPTPAGLAVIEGVMGLYDGQIGGDGFASTAHVAALTRSPVVLVVDISHASRTIGAVVHGLVTFDPEVRIGGVILNKAGSERHAAEVSRALEATGVPVLGVLPRDDGIVAPSRHLGLVPADERDDAAAALDRLAERVTHRVDLDAVVEIAHSAPPLDDQPWDPAAEVTRIDGSPVVAVAGGRAFTFRYTETTELLTAAGCEIAVFDPLTDAALPAGTRAVYLGGGFPEVHAAGLAANAPLRAALREAVRGGVPTLAECAGLLYLCRSVDGAPMVGALDAEAVMTPRLTLAYRRAVADADTLLGPAGTRTTGHEFHRTTVTPVAGGTAAWAMETGRAGFASPTLHASYLHTHWAGHPALAQSFARAAETTRWSSAPEERGGVSRPRSADVISIRPSSLGPLDHREQLRYHGDAEVRDGLVDFAVNVHDAPRPAWLDDALRVSLDDARRYPDPSAAERALARRHGRSADDVLATAGAAEAFGLIARWRAWRRPVVVHPQFTEPDVALGLAGHDPEHVFTGPGFALEPERVPADADLVIVGNPTNPTGVLHPEAAIRSLAAPGRIVVVDEAFMDSVPAEHESLAGAPMPGFVVVRSLTKLWSIPGVRAGYVLAEPGVIAGLRDLQTPWSVSTPAIAAMIACSTPDAVAEAATRAHHVATWRRVLTDGLTELGVHHVAGSAAPFVLAQVGAGVHARLRDAGYALRRADTFPGLDDTWVRIAVRPPEVTRKLLAVLRLEVS